MAKKMKTITLILLAVTFALWLLNYGRGRGIVFSLAVTSSTMLYHFGMRLCAGTFVKSVMQGKADYNSRWFREKSWEPSFYKALKVKSWKSKMPTYSPDDFDGRHHTLQEIAGAMCQAEVVHEVIVVLSFLPMLAVKLAGAFPVFLITSVIAAGIDISFAVMQRYNRPRVIKILEKQKNKHYN